MAKIHPVKLIPTYADHTFLSSLAYWISLNISYTQSSAVQSHHEGKINFSNIALYNMVYISYPF